MNTRRPMIGVRMEPAFREEIKAEAEARFDGNESLLLREAARIYLRLRRKLGVQFEPTIALWTGDDHEERTAA